jgi:hypothetical protein
MEKHGEIGERRTVKSDIKVIGLDLDTEEGANEYNRRALRCRELRACLHRLDLERKRIKNELKKESSYCGYFGRND